MKKSILNPPVLATATIETIYERRAIRKYQDRSVDKKTIELILNAGRMAPSAINIQPWKFYVLTNKEIIEKFSSEIGKITSKAFLKAGAKKLMSNMLSLFRFTHLTDLFKFRGSIFHGAPVVIFITASRDNEWASLDIGMCSQNMMLAAKSLGLDSCPIGLGKFVEKTTLYPLLKIPPTDQVVIAVIFGYGDENPEVHKRINDNAFFIAAEPKRKTVS